MARIKKQAQEATNPSLNENEAKNPLKIALIEQVVSLTSNDLIKTQITTLYNDWQDDRAQLDWLINIQLTSSLPTAIKLGNIISILNKGASL